MYSNRILELEGLDVIQSVPLSFMMKETKTYNITAHGYLVSYMRGKADPRASLLDLLLFLLLSVVSLDFF